MAATPTLIQTVVAASSVAAPASFTGTYAATTPGSLLVIVAMGALSGAPTMQAPAGWSTVSSAGNAGNTLAGRIWCLVNNAGSITNVTTGTLTNVNGIAMVMYEFANVPTVGVLDPQSGISSYANSTTTPIVTQPVIFGNQLFVGMIGSLTGQALTNTSTPSGWVASATSTSTVGATNVQIIGLYILPGPVVASTPGGAMIPSGSLAGALAAGAAVCGFNTLNTAALRSANDAGGAGVMVGSGAGYAVGG